MGGATTPRRSDCAAGVDEYDVNGHRDPRKHAATGADPSLSSVYLGE